MNNDTATTANCMEQSSNYQDMALCTSDNFVEGCYRNIHLDSLLSLMAFTISAKTRCQQTSAKWI